MKEIDRLIWHGQYQKALTKIKYLLNISNEFNSEKKAEVYLAFGIVIGFTEPSPEYPYPQQISQQFLLKAYDFLKKNRDTEKLVKCENGLANTFERSGDFKNARIWLQYATNRYLPEFHYERLYSYIIEAILDCGERKFKDLQRKLESRKMLFVASDNLFLLGNFYSLSGLVYKNLANFYASIICLEKARDLFIKLGHQIFLSSTLNNLAQLYRAERRFPEAFAAAARSRKIFKRLGKKTFEAFAADTQAGILLEQNNFRKAEKFIRFAVAQLENLEKKNFLYESWQTQIKILIGLGKLNEALTLTARADNLASLIFGENRTSEIMESAGKAVEEFIYLPAELKRLKQKEFWTELEGVEFFGVKIRNNNLEGIGLRRGNLAIVAEQEVFNGDLAAVLDFSMNEVEIGYLSSFLDFTALEIPNAEPVVFDFRKIKILGKVVGKVNQPEDEFPVINLLNL